jgi:hypothetical protein
MQRKGSREERKLCKVYKDLNSNNQHALINFANFLAMQQLQGNPSHDATEEIASSPVDIPRPTKESVIKGIRRLNATYPMLETDCMFDSISKLMTSHLMEGRSAEVVIDDLQTLFEQQYVLLNNG